MYAIYLIFGEFMVYYGVLVGKVTGIFDNLEKAYSQLKGVSGSKIIKIRATTPERREIEFNNAKKNYLNYLERQKEQKLKKKEKLSEKKEVFYGVWVGRNLGVFTSWDECRLQVDGYSEAKYRKIKADSLDGAKQKFLEGYE